MAKIQQGRLFDPATVTSRQFEPIEALRSGAQAYAAKIGQTWDDSGLENVQVDPVRGHATYLAYRDAMRRPNSETPDLRESYDALRQHVNAQYEYMTTPRERGGMGLAHEVTDSDPYPSPAAMADDLRAGRIRTFATASTGPHEFFSNEENDRFRAVHDVFGHAAIGRGFSRHGEEAAYRAHAMMFPPGAHAALATETRGQNSYLNYGPGGFASQEGRLVGLPQWAERTGPLPTPAPRPRVRQGVQQKLPLGGV